MASSQDGNMGLWSGYTPGDNGWTAQHNSNWDALDALAQCTVKATTTTTPPGSPANGDAYIVPSGATGAWASQTNKIAVWVSRSSAWVFYSPKNGWDAYDQSTASLKVFNGTSWATLSSGGTRSIVALGNITGAVSINLASGNIYTGTLTGNVTFTWTNLPASGFVTDVELRLTQDGTGGRTATWPANGKWPGASPFVLSTPAAAMDIVGISVDSSNNWIGYPVEAVG